MFADLNLYVEYYPATETTRHHHTEPSLHCDLDREVERSLLERCFCMLTSFLRVASSRLADAGAIFLSGWFSRTNYGIIVNPDVSGTEGRRGMSVIQVDDDDNDSFLLLLILLLLLLVQPSLRHDNDDDIIDLHSREQMLSSKVFAPQPKSCPRCRTQKKMENFTEMSFPFVGKTVVCGAMVVVFVLVFFFSRYVRVVSIHGGKKD